MGGLQGTGRGVEAVGVRGTGRRWRRQQGQQGNWGRRSPQPTPGRPGVIRRGNNRKGRQAGRRKGRRRGSEVEQGGSQCEQEEGEEGSRWREERGELGRNSCRGGTGRKV